MFHATTPTKGPSTVDCEVLTDIHTQTNLAEVEIISLVHELLPRYRLRADTEFACSNEDFIQTPRIDGSDFDALTNPQIRALLDYYASSSDRVSQMTKTYHDISAVTRLLEDRENDLQMAVTLGHTLLESNDTLRNQMTLLENDIEQTTEIVKQLKHDLILKERLLRFYTDMEDSDMSTAEVEKIDTRHYEQKIRNLEHDNQELRDETMQLKIEAENYEQQEQAIVDNFVNALASANTEIDTLHDELSAKTDENSKQNDEIVRLSYDMRDIRRRLNELKKENDELRSLLSSSGNNRLEYESKIHQLEKNYSECLDKLHHSQLEVNSLQQKLFHASPSSSMVDVSPHRHTVFLSPVEYANFMGTENSLKSELEEVLEDPNQLCPSTINADEPLTSIKKAYRRRLKRDPSDTDGDSTMNDSAFSDTESLSSASSCPYCHRCSPVNVSESKYARMDGVVSHPRSSSSSMIDRRIPSGISSRLKLVKRFEGSHMLKRWQELAEPSLSSCLQSIPGVYTRAEILHGVQEEDDDDPDYRPVSSCLPQISNYRQNLMEILADQGFTGRPLVPDPDDDDDDREPTTPPSSPIQGAQIQTNALLQQVMQRLVGMSVRTLASLATSLTATHNDDESDDEDLSQQQQRRRKTITITPPPSPTFTGLAAPTPNTAMRAIKSSTFLRVSSLNPLTKAFAARSPGEVPAIVNDFLRGFPTHR